VNRAWSRIALSIFLPLSFHCFAQNQQQTPATLRSVLLQELHTTHNQAQWFVPIGVAVDGLTAEQASWQPAGGGHSAGQLTYRRLFWNRRALAKFKNEDPGNTAATTTKLSSASMPGNGATP
jgi:hypothetical protein